MPPCCRQNLQDHASVEPSLLVDRRRRDASVRRNALDYYVALLLYANVLTESRSSLIDEIRQAWSAR
jgi:hypothetical protein